jgi:hypothetical protein
LYGSPEFTRAISAPFKLGVSLTLSHPNGVAFIFAVAVFITRCLEILISQELSCFFGYTFPEDTVPK